MNIEQSRLVGSQEKLKSRYLVLMVLLFLLVIWFALSLPNPLFDVPYSPVMYDRNGAFLDAAVAADDQWRFPPQGRVDPKFAAALIEYEDRRFRVHPGVDGIAIARAVVQNIQVRRIVSGASTITMQTIRMMRGNKGRTIFEKVLEAVLAVRLEIGRSKEDILALYGANAPFGGNVVGIEAAAWRWFAHTATELSWAEAATLAILPNAPSLVHPGRNREVLRQKRDGLLVRLHQKGYLDEGTMQLAMAETLPLEPKPLPQHAPHLFSKIILDKEKGLHGQDRSRRVHTEPIKTSLDMMIQSRAAVILQRRAEVYARKGILNAACLILDTPTGEVRAYIGNVKTLAAGYVDIIKAPRSSGSILKPFLFAAMLDAGELMPTELVSDIPTRISSYHPENNTQSYTGVIPAGEALTRSLNVPAVRALRGFGVGRFVALLKSLGVSTLFRSSDAYGLPLILGGAEITLWDMAGLYAGLARTAMADAAGDGNTRSPFFPPVYYPGKRTPAAGRSPLSPGAAWLTLNILTTAVRPDEEASWQNFADSYHIAWKTGTSFGFRDGWAIGVTPRWTVAVWIGNASGEGRAELRAATTAAPVLFEVFSFLEPSAWIPKPTLDLTSVEVCALSGFPAGPHCEQLILAEIPNHAPPRIPCPFCKTIVLNAAQNRQITLSESPTEQVVIRTWFVLPPAEEWYFRRWNLDYKPLPPFEGQTNSADIAFALFNPAENAQVYVPIELDGRPGKVVFMAAHREQDAILYWHLDKTYLGQTTVFHEIECHPEAGSHTLTVIDRRGTMIKRNFVVLNQ
ncbi:MAG: penicillin-binding protein 1C [Treponema sp.]|jgi:penicillin-binding protein 1C|nr:penicillin-binding protein 1C [Treponema sp.]